MVCDYMKPSERKFFFNKFADGKVDLSRLSEKISILYLEMLKGLI
jgi:hypothetical protein